MTLRCDLAPPCPRTSESHGLVLLQVRAAVGRAYEDLTGYFPESEDQSGDDNYKKAWFRHHLHTYACAPPPPSFPRLPWRKATPSIAPRRGTQAGQPPEVPGGHGDWEGWVRLGRPAKRMSCYFTSSKTLVHCAKTAYERPVACCRRSASASASRPFGTGTSPHAARSACTKGHTLPKEVS